MSWASGEVVGVLTFLLPGFIAATVFYSLTSHPRPGAFDRIVVALVFTSLGQAISEFVNPFLVAADGIDQPRGVPEPVLSVFIAVALGVGASQFSNTDAVHKFLRWTRITRETSYPSEWYSTFATYGENCFVVLHLQGERRIYGFAEEWPSNPRAGHFRVAEAEWLDDKNVGTPLSGVAAVLIPSTEVTMVEFVHVTEDRQRDSG